MRLALIVLGVLVVAGCAGRDGASGTATSRGLAAGTTAEAALACAARTLSEQGVHPPGDLRIETALGPDGRFDPRLAQDLAEAFDAILVSDPASGRVTGVQTRTRTAPRVFVVDPGALGSVRVRGTLSSDRRLVAPSGLVPTLRLDRSTLHLSATARAGAGAKTGFALVSTTGAAERDRLVAAAAIDLVSRLYDVPVTRCLAGLGPSGPQAVEAAFDALTIAEREALVLDTLARDGLVSPDAGPSRFAAALALYQRDRGLPASGTVTLPTYRALATEERPVIPGRPVREDAVRVLPAGVTPHATPVRPGPITHPPTLSLALKPHRPVAGAPFRVEVVVDRTSEVYCYYAYAEGGRAQVVRLFPNRFQPHARLRAGRVLVVPTTRARFSLRPLAPGRTETVGCVAQAVGTPRPGIATARDLVALPGLLRVEDALDRHIALDARTTAVRALAFTAR